MWRMRWINLLRLQGLQLSVESKACVPAKKARVSADLSEKQVMVDWVQAHPELFNKKLINSRMKKDALWAKKAKEMGKEAQMGMPPGKLL